MSVKLKNSSKKKFLCGISQTILRKVNIWGVNVLSSLNNMPDSSKIAIIDMGGQYVSNFERVLGEDGIVSEILPYNITVEEMKKINPNGIILSGGPYSVYDREAPKLTDKMWNWISRYRIPVLGVCYGHQLIASRFQHASVARAENGGEYGFTKLKIIDRESGIFSAVPSSEFICWMSHGDSVKKLPKDFKEVAKSERYDLKISNAAISHKHLPIYGLQFHPEVTHTQYGDKMILGFATEISKVIPNGWSSKEFIKNCIADMTDIIGNRKTIVAVSGGVDSTVAAVLAKKSIKEENLHFIHVDTGLMRKYESEEVVSNLRDAGLNVKCIKAANRFLPALSKATDSDARRKIVGEIFIRIFEEEAKKFGASCLLQATIAPDVIESTRGQATGKTEKGHGGFIKLHHNVGGLPDEMGLEVVEPLRKLFKYQVRHLARELNIPHILSERQPQPGPSGAVRIIGKINKEKIKLWQEANLLLDNKLSSSENAPTQYFTILLQNRFQKNKILEDEIEKVIREYIGGKYEISIVIFKSPTVGVKGDERVYGKCIGIGIHNNNIPVWKNLNYVDLLNLQAKITGVFPEVVRISFLNSPLPLVKAPYVILIKAIETRDFMTAIPSDLTWNTIQEMDNSLRKVKHIGATYFDFTTKPSSTIEYI